MKAIVDIGTHLYNAEATKILLPHFIDYYKSIGINKFYLHGNTELIESINDDIKILSNYTDIIIISISPEKYSDYCKINYNTAKKLQTTNNFFKYNQSRCGPNMCSLFIIQNELKEKYLKNNEHCLILDLDEFVDITNEDLVNIENSDIDFVCGHLIDRIFEGGKIKTLKANINIFDQLKTPIALTKFSGRAVQKIIITKGHLKHCHGHHSLYVKNDLQTKIKHKKIFNIWHMKYFKQNVEYILRCPHALDKKYIDINNYMIKSEIFKLLNTNL